MRTTTAARMLRGVALPGLLALAGCHKLLPLGAPADAGRDRPAVDASRDGAVTVPDRATRGEKLVDRSKADLWSGERRKVDASKPAPDAAKPAPDAAKPAPDAASPKLDTPLSGDLAACTAIAVAYQQMLATAKACSLTLPVVQCVVLVDDKPACACPTSANHLNGTAITALQTIAQNYVKAGCAPKFCPKISCLDPLSPRCAGGLCVDN